MANAEHLSIPNQGTNIWNDWRERHPAIQPDLSSIHLRHVEFCWGKFQHVDLSRSNLSLCNFSDASLRAANLEATLVNANLDKAKLVGADLRSADLRYARLVETNFEHANLVHCATYCIAAGTGAV